VPHALEPGVGEARTHRVARGAQQPAVAPDRSVADPAGGDAAGAPRAAVRRRRACADIAPGSGSARRAPGSRRTPRRSRPPDRPRSSASRPRLASRSSGAGGRPRSSRAPGGPRRPRADRVRWWPAGTGQWCPRQRPASRSGKAPTSTISRARFVRRPARASRRRTGRVTTPASCPAAEVRREPTSRRAARREVQREASAGSWRAGRGAG
jgi:hypothetical protein